jgi:hypothetical protein
MKFLCYRVDNFSVELSLGCCGTGGLDFAAGVEQPPYQMAERIVAYRIP